MKPQQKMRNAAVAMRTKEPKILPFVRIISSPRPSPLRRSAIYADKNHTYKTRNGKATSGDNQPALPAACVLNFGISRTAGASEDTNISAMSCRRS